MFSKLILRNNVLKVLFYILFVSILWITIERLLMWNVFDPFLNNQAHILLSFFGYPQVEVHLDYGSATIWICWFVILASTILATFNNRFIRFRDFWLTCLPLLSLLVISGLSVLWSVQSGYSSARFLLLIAVALGGFYVSIKSNRSIIQRVLEGFAALLVVGNSLMQLLRPQFAITALHTWVGIFSWKLPAGTFMGFAIIMFLFRLANFNNESWVTRSYSLVFYVTAWFLLAKSQSMTEILAVLAVHGILVLGVLYLKWGHSLKPGHGWIIVFAFLFFTLALWFGRGIWLSYFGRHSDLTGRLPLWEALFPYIKQRLFFGYGFGEAFWKIDTYYPNIWLLIPFTPVFAQNGYIEALLDTGFAGLALWIIFLIQVAYFSIRLFVRQKNLMSLIFFAWFTYTAVANIANNHLGSYETFTWLLLVIAFFYPLKEMLEFQHAIIHTPRPK